MLGLAKALYKQETKGSMCKKAVDAKLFSHIDVAFAEALQSDDEDLTYFYAALMAFARRGHLCFRIENGKLFPSLSDLAPLSQEMLEEIEERVIRGSKKMPEGVFQNLSAEEMLFKPIGCFLGSYYLQKNWFFETEIIRHLQRLGANHLPCIEKEEIDRVLKERPLNREQKKAIQGALEHTITAISGGPGTGKTHAICHLIDVYLTLMGENVSVILGAPTGKAASHLMKNAIKILPHFQRQIKWGTLHRLLHIHSAQDLQKTKAPLFADLVIIDECSMIDLPLFAILLSAIGDRTRLVLVGDQRQLPPVGAGTIFGELVEVLEQKKSPSTFRLITCLRSEQKKLLDLAQLLTKKEPHETLEYLKASQAPPVTYIEMEEVNLVQLNLSASFPSPAPTLPSPEKLFLEMDRFRILSSLRKGPFGVVELNLFMWEMLSASWKEGMLFPVPLIITKTSYSLELYNGETGILIRHFHRDPSTLHPADYALFISSTLGEIRKIPAAKLPPYELAYCLSVHKSQGSEYERVLFFMPEGSETFGREMIYTAMTRAKEEIVMIGHLNLIKASLEKSSKKYSSLRHRNNLKQVCVQPE